jgi:hypothetical protein
MIGSFRVVMNDLLKSVSKVSVRTVSNRQRMERTLRELLAGRQTIREIRQIRAGESTPDFVKA